MNFFEYIQDLNLLSVVIRVAMAVACGGILGLERKRAGHASGMRTYMLMSLGAAIVILTSQYMYNYFSESHPDAERLGAQVISGAAVLAASVIVVSKRNNYSRKYVGECLCRSCYRYRLLLGRYYRNCRHICYYDSISSY